MKTNRLMHFRQTLSRPLAVAALALLQFACSTDKSTPVTYDAGLDLNPLGPSAPNNQPPVTPDVDNPDFWVLNGGIEDGTSPWQSRGGETVISQSSVAYEGDHGLLVEGRSVTWHGAQINLPLNLPSNTYRASVWVRLAEGEQPTNMQLTLERKEAGQDTEYPAVARAPVTDGEWVQLTGVFTHSSTNATETLLFYIEAEEPTASYHIDSLSLEVTEDVAPANPADPSSWIINGGAEEGVTPWRGNPQELSITQDSQVAHTGDYSLFVAGRTANWQGAVMDLPKTLPVDKTYQASVWVRLPADAEPTTMGLTLKRQLVSQENDAEGLYIPIASAEQVTGDEWVELKGTFEHPAFEGELKDFYVYVEAAEGSASYYVDDLSMVNAGELVINSGLETSANGWSDFAGATVARTNSDAHGGEYSLLVSDREETYQGGGFTFAALSAGTSYNISCWVKMAPENPATSLALSLAIMQGEATAYRSIATLESVTSDTWVQLAGTHVYQLDNPAAPVDEVVGYVEAPENANAEYLIDDCSITLQ